MVPVPKTVACSVSNQELFQIRSCGNNHLRLHLPPVYAALMHSEMLAVSVEFASLQDNGNLLPDFFLGQISVFHDDVFNHRLQ